MTTMDDFIALVSDELGLPITREDVSCRLDEVAGWDSIHLLALATALERETGRRIVLPDLLEAETLEGVYTVAVGA